MKKKKNQQVTETTCESDQMLDLTVKDLKVAITKYVHRTKQILD